MKIRKFFAGSSRDALRLVREALGPDAVVLSNRAVEGGVELVALAENDLATLATPGDAGGMPAAARPAEGQAAARAQFSQRQSQAQPLSSAQLEPLQAPASPAPAARSLPDPFQAIFGHASEAGYDAPPARTERLQIKREAPITPALATARGLGAPAREVVMPGLAAKPSPGMTADPVASQRERFAAPLSTPSMAAPSAPAMAPAASSLPAASPNFAPSFAPQQTRPSAALPPVQQPAPVSPALTPPAAAPAAPSAPSAPSAASSAAAPVSAAPTAPAPLPAMHFEAPPLQLAPAVSAAAAQQIQAQLAQILATDVIGEIHSLRGALEEQLSTLMWNDRQRREPVRAQVTKTLLASGFSAQLVRLLIERMPTLPDHLQAMAWVKDALARNLPVLESEDTLMERGGVYALTGPTGVGKTTTTAKLAARCVMRYGADRVALLTTDSYRIGAHEQLRIYGKILGVAVHAVKDAADLSLALSELRNKHIVLIDTIGMSQRDRNVAEQVAMLCGSALPVQRLLLLNATSHGDTLNEVVHAYRNRPGAAGADLAGCILTKLDEATNIGAVLDTVVRYRLPVHYVSTGQKVPENLYVARKQFLLKSAFCIPRENSPFVPHEEDFPALMAGVPARALAELSEVRFG